MTRNLELEKTIDFNVRLRTTEISMGDTMKRRKWTATEITLLAQRYPENGLTGLDGLLGRSASSISSLARRLGVRSVHRHWHQALSRIRNKAAHQPGKTGNLDHAH